MSATKLFPSAPFELSVEVEKRLEKKIEDKNSSNAISFLVFFKKCKKLTLFFCTERKNILKGNKYYEKIKHISNG